VRVDEPEVLADQFSVQVRLAPAPVVAGVSTRTATIRPENAVDLARKVAVADHLVARGAPVVANSRDLPPGPHEYDGPGGLGPRAAVLDGPDRGRRTRRPEQLALASDLRAVHLALCMLSFRAAFGDDPAWDGYIRDFVGLIRRP
jgi:hypothetical protein